MLDMLKPPSCQKSPEGETGNAVVDFSGEEYDKFISNLEIISIVMLYSNCMRGPTVPPDLQMKISTGSASPTLQDDNKTEVDFPIRVDILPVALEKPVAYEEANNLYGFQLSAAFVVRYRSKSGSSLEQHPKEMLDYFAGTSAPFQLWPFIREHFATITAKMGLAAPFMLPLLVMPAKENKNIQDTQES